MKPIKSETSIRDMEQSVAELRSRTVQAVARQRRLEAKRKAAQAEAIELEEKAIQAVNRGNKKLARRILDRRVDALKSAAYLADDLDSATELATQLKKDLVRMQQQSGVVRLGRDEPAPRRLITRPA